MMLGIFFALLSPAIYAVVNYIDKFLLDKYDIPALVLTVYSGTIALLVSILLIIIFGLHIFPLAVIMVIILSGVFTQLVMLPYFKALSLEDTSTVIPLFQFVPVFVIIGDTLILGEKMTGLQYGGAILVILAGILLSIKKTKNNIFKPRKAFGYMMLACLFSALSLLLFKYGISVQNFWQILPYEGMGIALCTVCLLFLPGKFKLLKKETNRLPKKVFLLMSIDEAVYIVSRYTGFFALAFISASLVSVLGSTQPLFVLLYGTILSLFFPFILKEKITKQLFTMKLVAVVLTVLGVALISV
ncbi:MAG TPA: EamA family transporter [Patescibacteria group bacterium]|nr:EamA family transporter [Patescibacteria group bacterium]